MPRTNRYFLPGHVWHNFLRHLFCFLDFRKRVVYSSYTRQMLSDRPADVAALL